MSQAAKRHATYEDVLAAPENHVAQVLDGELYVHPRPARRHTRAASALGARLVHEFDSGPNGEGGGWIILYEPELHLARDIIVPDLAGWRVSRFPPEPEDGDAPFFTVAPDWVCEVLSSSTARIDRVKKVPIYARERVAHVWLVDPRDRTIEVQRLGTTRYEVVGTWAGDDGPFALEPFDSVPLPAAAFWGRDLPP
jgi:Uma2 family endonuclease